MNGEHKVWSWIHTGNCWIELGQGSRDEMIVQLRQRREAAARIMASARFVMTGPAESPDQAYANDPYSADMPPPLRAGPPSAPGPWEPGYRLSDAEAAEVLRASADRETISMLRAQVAALQGRLDFYEGRNVVHCMERNASTAMEALADEGDGTILRTTDTGAEWELRGGAWLTRA